MAEERSAGELLVVELLGCALYLKKRGEEEFHSIDLSKFRRSKRITLSDQDLDRELRRLSALGLVSIHCTKTDKPLKAKLEPEFFRHIPGF